MSVLCCDHVTWSKNTSGRLDKVGGGTWEYQHRLCVFSQFPNNAPCSKKQNVEAVKLYGTAKRNKLSVIKRALYTHRYMNSVKVIVSASGLFSSTCVPINSASWAESSCTQQQQQQHVDRARQKN